MAWPTASIADLYERGISTGSVSKPCSLAGLRLGWTVGLAALQRPDPWTVPWLAFAARVRLPDPDAPVPVNEQSRARSPRHLVPPRLAAFGGFACLAQIFLPPDRSFWISLVAYGLITVAVAGLLVRRAEARLQRLVTGREIPWRRALAVRLGTAVVVLGTVVGLVNYELAGSRLPDTFSMR